MVVTYQVLIFVITLIVSILIEC